MTNDVSGAVKAAKSGRVDFKIDKTAIVHVGLGKVRKISIDGKFDICVAALLHALLMFVFFCR